MKYNKVFFLLPLLLLASARANEIRIAASDLLADYIKAPLMAHGEANDITFKINGVGSLPSFDQLRSDEVDMAIIAVPQDKEVPFQEFSVYPFAYAVAMVIVNEGNPLNEISLSELGGIFGSSEGLSFNNWGDLGLSGWTRRSIKSLAGTGPNSIALELFKYSVFGKDGMKPGVIVDTPENVADLVGQDIASIAIVSETFDNKQVKMLMLSTKHDRSEGAPAFGPSDDNVHYGDYPIRLPFYIVYHQRDQTKLREVIRFLMSDTIAQSLEDNQLLALPPAARLQLLNEIN